jgi:MoaA/NifB/PqqE/SkfB family radical SAM enzyme
MKALTSAVAHAQAQALRVAIRLVPNWFERRLFAFAREAAQAIAFPQGRRFVRHMLRALEEILPRGCPRCRTKVLENLVVGSITGKMQRVEYHERTGLQPPYLLVLSPTMRCNLACTGCYAYQYRKGDELPHGLLDRILREARQMGISFITISGGEPFARPDLLDLYADHGDMYFQIYTNGTLITEAAADRLARLGNALPCISVEGFEAETDARRGPGTFRRVLAAMERLRQRGVFFGFSATATRENSDLLVSDAFVRFWLDQGCSLGWYFNYVPIGREPDLALMPTSRQRLHRRRRLGEIRERLPILLMDFWNDGALVGGCMAAGRYYIHINVHGDVEPCVFAQFAVDNIRTKSLHQVLDSPFFRRIRARQPYSDNYLRPCMIIDHPQVLREAVRESGAYPTYEGGQGLLTRCASGLDAIAADWGRVADREWVEEGSAALEEADRLRQDR